jgi:hypothetical protein
MAPVLSDIGTLAVGESSAFYITLYATNGDVEILSVDVFNGAGAWFSYPSGELLVAYEDEQAYMEFQYAPGAEGFHWGTITLRTSETVDDVHTLQMRGQGIIPGITIAPPIIDYGVIEPGQTASADVVVTNGSALALEISSIELDSSVFSTSSAAPLELAAGASVTLPVEFSPTNWLEATATLDVTIGSAQALTPVILRGNACSTASPDLYDQDGDGFSWCEADCDDLNSAVRPGAPEICDDLDNDCDGIVDEGTECSDDDGDGWSEDDGDCNDADPDVNPGEWEIPDNGIDDNCDGTVDAGGLDLDDDGYTDDGGDCDDRDPTVHPGARELLDLIDNDCDGIVDEGTSRYDDDGDGYTELAGDCDDTNPAIHPGATEIANWLDDDCDGSVDENTAYADDDGDGYAEWGGDCDDTNPSIHPGALDTVGDGVDSDCDGTDG